MKRPAPSRFILLRGLAALILTSLFGHGLAQAQALRCVDTQGNVSYLGAGAQTAGVCTPLSPQTSLRDPHEASRDAAAGQIQAARRLTDLEQQCGSSIASSLFAPDTARFTLSPSRPSVPSGGSVLAGYVEAQNRLGAGVRREVWCEFSASGTLQHAYVDYDPTVLR